jgi:hypothetical protein
MAHGVIPGDSFYWTRSESFVIIAGGDLSMLRYPELETPDWLLQKYQTELMSTTEMAAILGCGTTTITDAMRRHGIRVRMSWETRDLRKPISKDSKECSVCKTSKPIEDFGVSEKSRDGRRSSCKVCANHYFQKRRDEPGSDLKDYMKSWSKKNAKRYVGYLLKSKYGISSIDYNNLEDMQGGVCAICWNLCSSGKRLSVDHDHVTGAVRGLLCKKCNTRLGLANDDVSILKRDIHYLSQDRQPQSNIKLGDGDSKGERPG